MQLRKVMKSVNPIFQRLALITGSAGLEKLAQTRVIVFGLGGVGSWCAEALVRSGIGFLDIVDYDTVCESNINRQVQATSRTIGLLKAEVLKENLSSLILGARDFNKTNLPPKSRYGNKITSAVFFLVTGRHCKDTQTGLRGIPMFLADELLKINGKRFEYETNVLITLAKNKINFIEIPINTIYKNNNRETHFRPVKDSVLIYAQIIKFALSSLLSFVLDISLFSLFHAIVFISFADNIIYSTVAARILSGILNYNINKKAVFGVSGKSLKYFFRYASLFLILMFLSSISVKALANISRAHVTFIKIAVDTILFIFSFIIQKVLVFKNIKK